MAGLKKYNSREEVVRKLNSLNSELKYMDENYNHFFIGAELTYFRQMRKWLSKITNGVNRRKRENRNNLD